MSKSPFYPNDTAEKQPLKFSTRSCSRDFNSRTAANFEHVKAEEHAEEKRIADLLTRSVGVPRFHAESRREPAVKRVEEVLRAGPVMQESLRFGARPEKIQHAVIPHPFVLWEELQEP